MQELTANWLPTASLCIFIALAAPLVTIFPSVVIFAVLGSTISFAATLQLIGWRFRLPSRLRKAGQAVMGAAAGLCGGFAGVSAPLIVLYLLSMDIEKRRQLLIQGVVHTNGSLALIAAHTQTIVVSQGSFLFSAALVVPALLGLRFGTLIMERLDKKRFSV